MDAYGTARLAANDAESAIVARICEDFNLTPVLAKAHYEQMARYFAEYGQVPAQAGELCCLAVAAEEPPGKPIAACRKLQVPGAGRCRGRRRVAGQGLAVIRQGRLARLARQARVQGALLTVEDLAYLTCSSLATVKRDLAWLRPMGRRFRPAGRSATSALGEPQSPGPSAVPVGLAVHRHRAAHRPLPGRLRRYLADFRHIAALYARDASIPEIRAATGHSAELIAEYVGIYERAQREFPAAPRLADLLGAGAKR
jgi:hypothetical protein